MKITIACGSAELFRSIEGFVPNDLDFIVIKDTNKIYQHKHPKPGICHFIWNGQDKEGVRKYITLFPNYLLVLTLVTKEFIDIFDLKIPEVISIIDKYYSTIKQTEYAYYIPFFDYIKKNFSWQFPKEVTHEAYEIYLKVKKKA